MAVRAFDGTDDEVRFPIAANLTGAFTLAALAKRGADGAWHCLVTNATSAGPPGAELLISNNEDIMLGVNGAGQHASVDFVVANGWSIVAVTKAAGTTTGRVHIKPLSGAWTHAAVGAAMGNPNSQAGGTTRLGETEDVDDLNGKLAVVGEWAAELTDGQVEALATNLNTSDWTGHAVAPAWVVEPGQNTPIEDLIGSTDSTTITGTTIDSGDDPAGWTFAPAAAPRVMAGSFNAIPFMRGS